MIYFFFLGIEDLNRNVGLVGCMVGFVLKTSQRFKNRRGEKIFKKRRGFLLANVKMLHSARL